MKSKRHFLKPAGTVLLLLFLLVCVNLAVSRLCDRFGLRLDLTEDNLYTLSGTTNETLSALPCDISIDVFSSLADYPQMVTFMLAQYSASAAGHIQVQYIDPYVHPAAVDAYVQQGFSITQNCIAVAGPLRTRVIAFDDLFQTNGDGELTSIDIEPQITSAIRYVTNTTLDTVQFITGHDESYPDALELILTQNCFSSQFLSLTTQAIGCDLLMLCAPKRDFTPDEVKKLDGYLAQGGRMAVFLNSSVGELPNLSAFLNEWGIGQTDTLIAESSQYLDSNPLNIVPVYAAHPINSTLSGSRVLLACPETLALKQLYSNSGSIRTKKVLYSTDQAYAYQGSITLPPYVLAMTAENTQSGARIFVFGGSGLLAESILSANSFGNAEFLAQVIGWCSQREDSFYLQGRDPYTAPIAVTAGETRLFAAVFMAALPALILLGGLVLYLRRKHL